MAVTTIDSTNFQDFAAGKVIEPTKAPEKKAEDVALAPKAEWTADKAEIANETDLPEEEYKLLTEKQQRAVNKKHRAMKEADEFAEEQYRERRAAERRAEEAEARLREFESKAAPKEVRKEPDPKDFTSEKGEFDAFGYAKALAKYEAEEAVAKDRQERAAAAAKEAEEASYQAYLERVKSSAAGIEDWEEVAQDAADLRVSSPLTQYIRECDAPAPILYHFAQNPAELKRLNALSPIRAIAEVTKLEARLTEKSAKAEKPEPEKAAPKSKAPEPIAPLNGGTAPVHKDLKDMSTRETIEYWEAREKSKATRRKRH